MKIGKCEVKKTRIEYIYYIYIHIINIYYLTKMYTHKELIKTCVLVFSTTSITETFLFLSVV